jgi:hypothetical protein
VDSKWLGVANASKKRLLEKHSAKLILQEVELVLFKSECQLLEARLKGVVRG